MLWSVFLSKLLTLGILFSTAVRAVVVTKSVILGILFSTSFILALRVVLVATLVISGIFYLSIIYIFFNKTIFTASLNLLKQQELVLIYQHLIYLLYF